MPQTKTLILLTKQIDPAVSDNMWECTQYCWSGQVKDVSSILSIAGTNRASGCVNHLWSRVRCQGSAFRNSCETCAFISAVVVHAKAAVWNNEVMFWCPLYWETTEVWIYTADLHI